MPTWKMICLTCVEGGSVDSHFKRCWTVRPGTDKFLACPPCGELLSPTALKTESPISNSWLAVGTDFFNRASKGVGEGDGGGGGFGIDRPSGN